MTQSSNRPAANLEARAERRLIRTNGSARHMDFIIRAAMLPGQRDRAPLRLALVLDRSGSMAGDKLETAKRAALSVADRLGARDQLAVVAFDDEITVLQPAASPTPALKQALRITLGQLEARAYTALHEGWLTGCNALVSEEESARLSRCFLLTDGLANVGISDPEQIAAEAAGVRARTGIGTSTFGIGEDYDESLLGPMAVAGGGQFHHLRSTSEIAATFAGELGELFAVAASHVQLEIRTGFRTQAEMISGYSLAVLEGALPVHVAEIGDLIRGEERHVIVRFRFPERSVNDKEIVEARLRWMHDGQSRESEWTAVRFRFAEHAECDHEVADPTVLHWEGLHHADRARREAAALNQRGDLAAARRRIADVAQRIAQYAGDDAELRAAVASLRAFEQEVAESVMPSYAAKEAAFQATRSSRGQRDLRGRP